jgi:hypothetical protein
MRRSRRRLLTGFLPCQTHLINGELFLGGWAALVIANNDQFVWTGEAPSEGGMVRL